MGEKKKNLRDTEGVVRLLQRPGAESSGWLGGQDGYLGATWNRKLEAGGKRTRANKKKWPLEGREGGLGSWPCSPRYPSSSLLSSSSPEVAHALPAVTPPTPPTAPSSAVTSQLLAPPQPWDLRLTLSPSPSGNPGRTCLLSLVYSSSRELEWWQGAVTQRFTGHLLWGTQIRPHPDWGLGGSSPILEMCGEDGAENHGFESQQYVQYFQTGQNIGDVKFEKKMQMGPSYSFKSYVYMYWVNWKWKYLKIL